MAKKSASASTPQKVDSSTTSTTPLTPAPPAKPVSSSSSLSPRSSPQDIALHVWNKYLNETPARTKLLDVFMLFLVLVGAVQFLYCILAGNYPFNAFLSGFCSAVGQFVLTASLRMQTTELPPSGISPVSNTKKGSSPKTINGLTGEVLEDGKPQISSERAFADFVFGSLILHAFCINFIN